MAKFIFGSPVILAAFFALWSCTAAMKDEQPGGDGLIAASDAVVAVEILSTDYTATHADGPMTAEANVLKSLKGPLSAGKKFIFSETAWVGPAYQKGEIRILFLEKSRSQEYSRAQWRILSRQDARVDFFIEKNSISDLTMESLESFLKKIQESKDRPKKVLFDKGSIS